MSEKKREKVLSEKELQQLIDNGFLSSSDDDEEIEGESDSSASSGDDDSSNSVEEIELSCSFSESESGDSDDSDDQNIGQQPNANLPQAQNVLNVTRMDVDQDGWHTKVMKPTLLKFRGVEKVCIDNVQPQPVTPADYFHLFFDDEMIDNIITFTNEKVKLLTHYKPQNRRSPLRNFRPITKEDFMKFLGLTILMGNIKMPSLKHYWKVKNQLYGHPIFGQIMSRNRYESILRALRFYDVTKPVSKKDKIQYVLKHLVAKFKLFYTPPKELSIDEALLGFKGRLSYKQYIPMKRSRFGIKLYELCASNGYVLDIILYTGKGTVEDSAKEKGHAHNVVMKLLRGYLRKGHALYLDNFYTSVTLAEDLFKRGTQITGTLRANRKGIPDIVKNVPGKSKITKLKRGESIFARRKHLLIQKWMDKKEILMISTRHNGEFVEVPAKFGPNKLKPKVIAEYNKFMGGVDKADQLTSYYTSPRKTMRWQLKTFFHLGDLSLWNALYLYNYNKPNTNRITYIQFRDAVITHCFGEIPRLTPVAVATDHMPVQNKKRIRCRYCTSQGKRTMTRVYCARCKQNENYVGLCIDESRQCFRKFHAENMYQHF